jgi:hypothetical protein
MGVLISAKEQSSRDGGLDYANVGNGRRMWLIRWSDQLATDTEILAVATLPKIYDLHPDGNKWVKSLKASQRKREAWLWDVEVEYSSNPLDVRPDIDWDGREHREAIQVDEDEVAVLNSAGLPFDPPPEILWYSETLTIVKNLATYDRDFYRAYRGAVNTDNWYGGGPYSSKCTRIAAKLMYDAQPGSFWRVTFQFECLDLPKPPGANDATTDSIRPGRSWYLRPLDAGYEEYNDDLDNWVKMKDIFGVEFTKPAPLDGAGHQLEVGGDPVYLKFRPFKTAEFVLLGLP